MLDNVSREFHEAIKGANPEERFMFVFDSGNEASIGNTIMLWTDADIAENSGVRVVEAVNGNSELSIGQTMASTLTMKVFNEHGYLNDFLASLTDYNTGTAYLGVKLAAYELEPLPDTAKANCVAFLDFDGTTGTVITGHNAAPYLRVNGRGVDIDYAGEGIDYPIGAIVVETPSWLGGNLMITAIPLNPNGDINIQPYSVSWIPGNTWGEVSVRTWGDVASQTWGELLGAVEDVSFPYYVPYMNNYKFPQIAESRRGFLLGENGVLYEFYTDGRASKWEYHSLGQFSVETPMLQNNVIADITAYDKMKRFDKPVADWLAGLSYPLTIGELYAQLCEYCELERSGSIFINSTVSIPAPPEVRSDLTGRALLSYIAEAACANARMDRDGRVELAWFYPATHYIFEENTFSISVSDYFIAPVDKMTISVPQEGSEPMIVTVGDGTNAYALSDNFLLYSDSASTVQARVNSIYQQMHELLTAAVQCHCVCDWSYQAGDTFLYPRYDREGSQIGFYAFPIYKQTIEYRGLATVYYECSGQPTRPTSTTPVYSLTANSIARLNAAVNEQNRAIARLSRRSAVSNMGLEICETEANTAAKTVNTAGGEGIYTTGTMLVVQFKQGNTAASPTLQIDSSPPAQLINGITGSVLSANDIKFGMYCLILYNGSDWVLLNPAQ